MDLKEEIIKLVRKEGIVVCGYAKLEDIALPPLAKGLTYAISLGYRLSDMIIGGIIDRPTRDYLHHYRQINLLLDQTALKLTSIIQQQGYNALPIPASQITDWKEIKGSISHKLIAAKAGIGWIGRSSLVIHPEYGAKVRYVSILTDMPLSTPKPIEFGCGECRRCIEACPCGAIKDTSDKFDRESCLEQLRKFAKSENLGSHYICGICVKVCNK